MNFIKKYWLNILSIILDYFTYFQVMVLLVILLSDKVAIEISTNIIIKTMFIIISIMNIFLLILLIFNEIFKIKNFRKSDKENKVNYGFFKISELSDKVTLSILLASVISIFLSHV